MFSNFRLIVCSLNRRSFAGSVLSVQRARPTKEILDQIHAEREEVIRTRIEENLKRREEELAKILTAESTESASVLIKPGTSEGTCGYVFLLFRSNFNFHALILGSQSYLPCFVLVLCVLKIQSH